MTKPTNLAIVLWASYFDELVAISFCYEFRQMGVSVKVVTLHSEEEERRTELLLASRQSLEETLAAAEEIRCLVVPSSATALGQFQQNPMLWQLIDAVHSNGGQIVIGRSEDPVDPATARLLPPVFRMIYYPAAEKLLIFARGLAHSLVAPDQAQGKRGKGEMPPLIRVANDSNPGTVAGAIAGIVREYGFAEIQSVGAAAGNQMLKAAAIAKSYLAVNRLSLFMVPTFITVKINGFSRSAIRLFISAWPVEMDNSVGWEVQTLVDADEE